MKNLLFTLIFLSFAVLGFSQAAPITVTNNINSGSVTVELYASPIGSCQVICSVPPFCIFPGQTMTIPPCFPSPFVEWNYAVVTATTDDCSAPCPPPSVTVISQNGCFFPPSASSFHCHAGAIFTSTYTTPTSLLIQ